MKKLITLTMALTFSVGVFAHGFHVGGKEIATVATISPFISTIQCFGGHTDACGYASATVLSSVLILKEEVKSVEGDAYNFIAGEPMTLALEEQVQSMRQIANGELDIASDEEVVAIMIHLAKK